MTQGTRLAARPTAYKGIQMRSRLEARYAAWLDEWRYRWEYEPQCFASQDGQYLPDFVVRDITVFGESITTGDVYVEVKPTLTSFSLDDHLRSRSIIADATCNPDAVLVLDSADQGLLMPLPGLGGRVLATWTQTDRGRAITPITPTRSWREWQ